MIRVYLHQIGRRGIRDFTVTVFRHGPAAAVLAEWRVTRGVPRRLSR